MAPRPGSAENDNNQTVTKGFALKMESIVLRLKNRLIEMAVEHQRLAHYIYTFEYLGRGERTGIARHSIPEAFFHFKLFGLEECRHVIPRRRITQYPWKRQDLRT